MTSSQIAFVAGATGYTGREVVRQLCARGIKTYAHIRPDSPGRKSWGETFSAHGALIDTTPWEQEALQQSFAEARPTLLFALLGTTKKRSRQAAQAGRNETYETIDYGLSVMLLDAAKAAKLDLSRFVYLSSMGVSPSTNNAYLKARWRVEEALQQSELPYTIARPSFITGDGRDENRPMERIGAKVADGMLSLVGALGGAKLRDNYRSTDNAHLAAALIALALDPQAQNTTASSATLQQASRQHPPR